MSRGKKVGIFAAVAVVVVIALVMMGRARKANAGTEVRMEKVTRRSLVSAVTASGKIDAKTSVDISADITGRITKIGVKEGDLVKKGQFLLQIDPTQYQAAVSRAEGLVASSQAATVQARANRDQAERALTRAKQLASSGTNLISPEAVEQAQTAFDVAAANLKASQAQQDQSRASLREAQDQLSKTHLVAPMDGRVVRVAKEVGEVAVPSTFSSAEGLLVTVADLSVILATVQVDETDVVRLAQGDSVQVTIDAFPDTTFTGRVTKISNSAVLTATQTAGGSQDRAVDFEVEVTLDNPPEDVRPDLSCTARIVTATRKDVLSVPIIALTVRDNEPVPNEEAAKQGQASPAPARDTGAAAAKKKDTEGVFVVQDGIAHFRPVKVGITGDEYFEITDGLKQDETIVAGTYQAIRDLKDGDKVKAAPAPVPGMNGAKS
ncbi:MAG TPA: efflux RND transporter periplasmic adaptor subunit [Gemmatimonadales bacterium]|jgi:HlyD family secretion protein|nr:efflux RND transporter periplasmic adaptor subunit [Gemmatimonadales bacterium]